MEKETYDKIVEKMPEIAKIVSSFPEKVQDKAFDLLISNLIGEGITKGVSPKTTDVPKAIQNYAMSSLAGIAMKTSDGNFHLSIRDLKATSASDAAKRLTYVIIRAYNKIMGEAAVSRKETINPHIESWRLNSGNTRNFLANDPGIIRNGDKYSLDIHAEAEADEFIKEIQDSNVSGNWKPNSRIPKKKNSNIEEKNESTV
ncbi:MAG: hypothetical protein WCV90_07130 [Candidatus Woesearchaeota archaeon]|jgi:hypothetical protein